MPASKRISFISSANCRLSPLPYEVSGSTPNASAFLHSVSVSIKQKQTLRWLRSYVGVGLTPDKSGNRATARHWPQTGFREVTESRGRITRFLQTVTHSL